VINGSVTLRRRVRGLRKGSEERSGVLREGVVGIGVRGLRVGGSVQVCIRVYKLPVNRTKT
jgi:hypothetical protein